ncbi:hypothetical protein [Arthrobacter caoxuetaonis]|uniref:Uncharacterized protein n=1 Tax=Arthrobacter caoxuetaonis TaxID=2886935 RepID=A0A9X1MFV0_9MICC|nr:hypothetical protein [Arthrobacter caoxuetaonis]MCC3299358.1 hypothetical protein [Arthrobacter caoxuetaonis]USQ59149.1 hypothetical protein NF551_18760 [Arthrobacter caoxuetaonis]
MTSTPSTQRKKDVGQAGNGGQFAAKTQSEPTGVEPLTTSATAGHDLTWWDEEDRAYPASLYEAGVDGILEPYNGDYPVNDGALRYWREDMTRELVIGELEDGTTVVAVEAEPDEGIFISVNAGTNPSPDRIRDAVDTVRGKATNLAAPES